MPCLGRIQFLLKQKHLQFKKGCVLPLVLATPSIAGKDGLGPQSSSCLLLQDAYSQWAPRWQKGKGILESKLLMLNLEIKIALG